MGRTTRVGREPSQLRCRSQDLDAYVVDCGRVKLRRYADERRASLTVKYFWYWRPSENFPPRAITRPLEFNGGDRLNVACTQTDLGASEQSKIVTAWCESLPNIADVNLLWFSSRVPQRLFEAACRVPNLEGLYIKWSGIDDLSHIKHANKLRYFHLGPSARVSSIEPLVDCQHLRSLGLELLSRIRELHPLSKLINLEELSLEGSMGTTWRVATLQPLGSLTNLRYLSLANLRADDGSLAGLFPLRCLTTFRHANLWNVEELAEICRCNQGLASV